jgi:hypothetical protein
VPMHAGSRGAAARVDKPRQIFRDTYGLLS